MRWKPVIGRAVVARREGWNSALVRLVSTWMYKSEDLQILEINNDMLIAVSGTKAPVLTHLKTSRSRMKGQTLGKLAETELSVLEYHKSDGYMIIVFLFLYLLESLKISIFKTCFFRFSGVAGWGHIRHIGYNLTEVMARFVMILQEIRLIMAEKHFCQKLSHIFWIKICYKCIFIPNYYD